MRLYSKNEWKDIPWPSSDKGRHLQAFLEPILKEGSNAFISNVKSNLYILHIDDLFLPITVNEREYHNSYVCSIYSYLLYAEEEMQRHQRNFLRIILFPILAIIKFWFKWSKINQLVSVNNFFLSTNLYDSISFKQVKRISGFLKQQFPHYAILFRSLNNYTEKTLVQTLKNLKYDFITSRSIYFFDPKNHPYLPSKKRWIIQKDQKLLKQANLQVIEHNDFKIQDASRIKDLYELLYLKKYSYFNPDFSIRFFEDAILKKTFILKGVLYEGNLVGVIGFFKTKGIMATPIVGYDTNLPEKLGLYRLLTILILEESLKTNTLFHMSAGVGHFKRQRGAFQELEVMAVYSSHLPLYRRVLWKVLALLFNKLGAPILKKYKL